VRPPSRKSPKNKKLNKIIKGDFSSPLVCLPRPYNSLIWLFKHFQLMPTHYQNPKLLSNPKSAPPLRCSMILSWWTLGEHPRGVTFGSQEKIRASPPSFHIFNLDIVTMPKSLFSHSLLLLSLGLVLFSSLWQVFAQACYWIKKIFGGSMVLRVFLVPFCYIWSDLVLIYFSCVFLPYRSRVETPSKVFCLYRFVVVLS